MTLQDNDKFLVDRDDTPYNVEAVALKTSLEDNDLMVVCRSGVPYKATGAQIKDALGGSTSINPGINDITFDSVVPGSGTEADPFILQSKIVAPAGSSTQTTETITIIGQPPDTSVVWRNNSIDSGSRFSQVTGELTDGSGIWTGNLEYADIPDSTEDKVYVGKLNIGLVYFEWTITQRINSSSPPEVTNVSLVEANPQIGDRFTSQSFVASSQVTDGIPTSVKTFDAHVDGTMTKEVQFSEPLESKVRTSGGWFNNTAANPSTWTAITHGGQGLGGAGFFVAVGYHPDYRVMFSDDGINWNKSVGITDPTSWSSVAYGNNNFVAVGTTYYNLMYSSDAISWFPVQNPANNSWESIAFGNGTFVAVSSNGSKRAMYTTTPWDAASWKLSLDNLNNANCTWRDITYGDGKFVAIADSGTGDRIAYSTDGATWTYKPIPDLKWYGITYGNGKYVAVSQNGVDRAAYSTDLNTWTYSNIPFQEDSTGKYNAITYGDGKFVAVSETQNRRIAFSEDAITWTLAGDGIELNPWQSIAYGNGKFVGVASTGAKRVMWAESSSLTDAVTSLTFASDADMDGLDADDSITQLNTFKKPLESSSVETITYTPRLTTNNGWVGYGADYAFNDDQDTYATGSANSQIVFDATGLGYKDCRVRIYINLSAGSTTCTDDSVATWSETLYGDNPYGGTFYGQRANIVGEVKKIYLQGNGGNNPRIGWIQFNDDPPLKNGPGNTFLNFPADTKMSELEPDDVVRQFSSDIQTGTLNAYNEFTIQNPESNCWDGNINTYAEVNNTDGTTSNTLDWLPAGGTIKEGDLVQIKSNSTGSFNCSPQQTFTAITSPFVGYEATIVGGELTFLRTSRSYGTPNQFNAIFVNGEQLIEKPMATVSSITGTTAIVTNSTGVWKDGRDVQTNKKESEGVVGSITDKTVTLSSSTGLWVEDNTVVGPDKTITEDNARRYCVFDSDGNVTDLQKTPQDPPYTTTDSNPGLTFTFPATFPSGQTPDEELPDGTTFTVDVSATNTSGTSGPVSATVQPEPEPPEPAPDLSKALAGLVKLYDGNGTSQSLTTGIDLVNNDGLVWIKNREAAYHVLNDTVRGAGLVLYSNDTLAEITSDQALTSFTDTGFTVGNGSDVNAGQNQYEAFTFQKAPGFFDVITYTGDGVSPRTISHNLGSAPGFIIIKRLDSNGDWFCSHKDLTNFGQHMFLNQPTLASGNNGWIGSVTDTQFKVYRTADLNASGATYVAYLFAADTPDVIKCGSYSGTGKVVTGFRPQWLLFKRANGDSSWYILDAKRPATNPTFGDIGEALLADDSGGEFSYGYFTFEDDGFTQQAMNNEGIYIAIAAPPIARSQTNEEFIETQAKFLTYDNRRDVKVGEEAMDVRHKVIKEAENLGLTKDQITKLFNE